MPLLYIVCAGGIALKIHSMQATFGKLQGKTLKLQDGLNIIEAPNETGKSTWCAFLVSMLYGMNSRERDRTGYIADKNRYTPWSGAPMSGRIEMKVGQREVTLTRDTKRPNAPMAEFDAVFTGTGEQVPGLTSQNCGEAILGVSREVFERSAFIRQAGLAIRQDPDLEKRIASLITSGEEDSSYTEAAEALKKQLNRRRHNKTGLLPTLEAQRAQREQQLSHISEIEAELANAHSQVAEMEQQAQRLQAELDLCAHWERMEQRQALTDAEEAASQANAKAEAMRRRLQDARIPDNHDIGRLRGALVNIQSTRKNVEKARAERDEAMKAVLRAEAPINESPFAGQSAESAQREAAKNAPKSSPLLPALLIAALAALGALTYFRKSLPSPMVFSIGLVGLTGICVILLLMMMHRYQKRTAWKAALTRRFGTDDPTAIHNMADDYGALLQVLDEAQEALKVKSAAADSLYASLSSNEQAILLEIRRFAPSAFDLSSADELLRSCAVLRKELADAERAAQESRLRRDVLGDRLPADEEDHPASAPLRTREQVEQELSQVHAALAQARSAADRLAGHLHAGGNPVELRSDAAHLDSEIADLEAEYQALTLAMKALECANSTIQTRFSPALGKQTAAIFRELTGDRYNSVSLDRALNLSVQPQGDAISRDAQLLSAGALDQLYLSTRLAICDLVLPADREIPLILDDALANFDDKRCVAALNWLKEAAKGRQVLLFTCHSREADFFRENPEVSVQQLTELG